MSNVNAPYGLLPFQSAVGSASNYENVQKQIAYNDTTKIYRGDPVKLLNTGYIAQWSAATDAKYFAGVFWGCTYLSSSLGKVVQSQFWPGADVASTAQETIVAQVIPAGMGAAAGLFRIQSDVTGIAFADINLNAEITVGTGNTLNGQSGAYLSGPAATATLPVTIVGLYGGAPGAGGFGGIQPSTTNPYGGSATGAYNWVIVRPNAAALLGL